MRVARPAAYLFLAACVPFIQASACRAAHAPLGQQKNIVYISNFSSQYYWNQTIKRCLRDEFKRQGISVNFYEEILNIRRMPKGARDRTLPILKKLYAEKYREVPIDLIMVSDDSLLGPIGRKLFPDTPFLFCYTRQDRLKDLAAMGNASATVDDRNPERIIDAALKMFPATRYVAVISDHSEVSSHFSRVIREKSRLYPERRFQFIFAKDKDDLVRRLKTLTPRTIIIDASYYSTLLAGPFRSAKSIVFEASMLPVFSLWSNPVEKTGLVAGLLLDTERHGRAAAVMAVRILRERSADSVAPMVVHTERIVADHAMLAHYHIDAKGIGLDPIIVNEPLPFHVRHKHVLITSAVLSMFFAGILFMMVVALRQKRREKRLLELELRAENDKAKARAQQEQARKMQALLAFSVGIAHDLSAIFAGISACVGFVREETSGDQKHLEQDLEQIEISSRRGKEIVERIAARPDLRTREPVPVESALDESVALLAPQLPEGVALTVENRAESACIGVDAASLHQIVQNLCLNAVQAMSGHGRLDVKLVADGEAGTVTLTVSDSGPGISPEVKEHIFEPYYTTRKSCGGTGLGLFSVLSIVTQAHGSVSVRSVAGHGASFVVILPQAVKHHEQRHDTHN
ncbi:MAG: hypothetical protein H0S80_11795 [Desulfovibrionaceae bacterium]|nr:hypothetical protein [Desulfovibrionaceae bacterium]